ncbi:MAG: hypothetical protein FWE39_15580, partial [Nocardiaceae bacterium]|nr:hypothetical protein [Nocardiaceae bacterium]
MMRFIAGSALAVGLTAGLAPMAAAEEHVPAPGFVLSSPGFVTSVDPDAWRPAPKWIIASPYGTDDIY